MRKQSSYVDSCGEPVILDGKVVENITNIASIGYLNINNTDDDVDAEIVVGDLYAYDNIYNPPDLDYGEMLFDCMDAYMSGDYDKCNQIATEFFDKDDMVKYDTDYEQDYLRCSEHNIEYCFIGDDGNVLEKIIEDQGNITLLNPSKGSVVRLCEKGFKHNIDDIFILDSSDEDYTRMIKKVAAEYDMKGKVVNTDALTDERNYYVGCHGYLGEKYSLKKYFGFDINFYSAMSNAIVDGIGYNNNETYLRYTRTGHKRISKQRYVEKQIYRYGSDFFQHRYKSSKNYHTKYGMCHDFVSSFPVFQSSVPIVNGKIMIANSYVLIGDYYHDKNNIYDNDGKIVYTSGCLNHNCRRLDDRWQLLNTKGDMLHQASYMISMFSSQCVYLGKKYKVKKCKLYKRDCVVEGVNYKLSRDDYDLILLEDNKGKIILDINGDKVVCCVCPLFPHNNQLWQYFKMIEYCYGTYHSLVQEVNKVNDDITHDEVARFFLGK